MDGPWQMGHRSADDYGKFALEGAKLMKWTDPDIKLIAAGSSNYRPGLRLDFVEPDGACNISSSTPIICRCIPMWAIRTTISASSWQVRLELDKRTKTAEGIIDAALSGEPGNRKIYIAWDEWNVWYRARGNQQRGRRILEERYNLEDALVVATFLNSFINHSHIVKIANMAQMVNVIAPIFTNEKGMFLQTIYYPLQLFANNSQGQGAGTVRGESEVQDAAIRRACRIWIFRRAYDNGSLVLNVVNRHRDQAIEAEFEAEDKQFSGAVTVSEVNGPDIKSENDFDKTIVKPVERSSSAEPRKLRCAFPAHSYTMLKVKLA